jgi:uncharacterized protein (DUF2336 family)
MKKKEVISHDDVAILATGNTAEQRRDVAKKLSRHYTGDLPPAFSDTQMKIVEDIFRLLVKDADVAVRKTLSESLSVSKYIPKDIVLTLAQDMEEIAPPVLSLSEVLDDADLISIIRSAASKAGHKKAIASRKTLSGEVSDALLETDDVEVVKTLLSNKGAQLGDRAYEKVMESFSHDEALMEALLTQHGLPESLLGVLQKKVSAGIKKKLEGKYKQNLEEIARAKYRERVAVPMKKVEIKTLEVEVLKVLDAMEKHGTLPLATALCNAHLDSFLTLLSKGAGVPIANMKKLYTDGNKEGINKLLETAGIVPGLVEGARLISQVLFEMKNPYRQREENIEAFTKTYVKAIRERIKGKKGEVEAGYLIRIIEFNAEEDMARKEAARKDSKKKK